MSTRSLPPGSLFDRYLLSEFLRFFFLALGGFVGFVVLVDAFEKIDTFIDYEATLSQVARYYLNSIPFQAVLVTPVALLLATFLSLGSMTRFQEITIMKSAGISLYRMFVPVFLVGLLVAGLSFVVTDWVMPGAQGRAKQIFEQEIRGRTMQNLGSRMNVTYIGQDNRFFVIRRYDVPRSTMIDAVVQEFDDTRLARRVDARKAVYENGVWMFLQGVDRRFEVNGWETADSFDTLRWDLPEEPADFAKQEMDPQQMSFPDLRDYVERVRRSGSPVEAFVTDLHLRIAFPLVNFVMVLIGASFAVQIRRGGIAIGFGLSLGISFVYWSLIRAGQVLGHSGTLPPMLAAWLGNIVFIAIGIYLLLRTPK